MAISHAKLAKVADKLIRANGRDITLVKKSSTPADPAAPWNGLEVSNATEIVAKGVFVIPASEEHFGRRDEDIKFFPHRGAEMLAFVSATQVVQEVSDFDFIKDGTTVWKVMFVEVLNPGSVRMFYTFGVKR